MAARRLDRARVQLREVAPGTVRHWFYEVGNRDLLERLSSGVAPRETNEYTTVDELVSSLEA